MDKPQAKKCTSPAKAIRAYCLNCCRESAFEVAHCAAEECELWDFRFGKNPHRKVTLTPEQIEASRERMKNANSARINANRHPHDDDQDLPV
jgi:hypothetical protein